MTRPEHDLETFYLSSWIKEVIDLAENKNIKAICLDREKANRKNVEDIIKKIPLNFLIFNGHGSDNEICGHNNEVLIKTGENVDLLKGKIVYSIACRSAEGLGREAEKEGVDAFIGYQRDFIIFTDTSKSATPLRDEFVRPFLESSNKIGISLVKGFTAKEAFWESQKSFEKWILYHFKSELAESPFILSGLLWDSGCQKLIGNENSGLHS